MKEQRLRIPGRRITGPALAVALLATLVGCSSDTPNSVGRGLETAVIDSVLVPLKASSLLDYSALTVDDPNRPFVNRDVLYFGSQGGNESAILVNVDFATAFGDSIDRDWITRSNIASPRLRLNMLWFYESLPRPGYPDTVTAPTTLRKFYELFLLTEPFDTTAAWPGQIPPYDPVRINASLAPDPGESFIVEIDVFEEDFVAWARDSLKLGLLIREGVAAETDSGLVGFSSRENRFPASTIGNPEEPVTVRSIGPTFRCKFLEAGDDTDLEWSVPSYADVSTFHVVQPPPPNIDDGIMMRMGLREETALLFDLSALPPDAYINRAVLVLHNDPDVSFGYSQSLVVGEMEAGQFGDPYRELSLAGLEGIWPYEITGIADNDPTFHRRLDFNVTQALQRQVNRVYDGTRGLAIIGGESFTTLPSGFGVDYWFTQFHFAGLADPDTSLRPRLEITYTVSGGLEDAND